MAMSNSRMQYLLAQQQVFISRCATMMLDVADGVLAEPQDTPGHLQRLQYARSVIANPEAMARGASSYLAQSTNVVAAGITMEDEGPRANIDDPGLLSQITAAWDILAGVESGTPPAEAGTASAARAR